MLASFLLSAALLQSPGPWQSKTFVIVASEPTYAVALTRAKEVAAGTGLPLDLRGLHYDPKHPKAVGGLSLSAKGCQALGSTYPCYLPRGRWEESESISVEYSSAISGFTPDLYVVIAAVGKRADLMAVLRSVRHVVPDAYLKSSRVYMGCMR